MCEIIHVLLNRAGFSWWEACRLGPSLIMDPGGVLGKGAASPLLTS